MKILKKDNENIKKVIYVGKYNQIYIYMKVFGYGNVFKLGSLQLFLKIGGVFQIVLRGKGMRNFTGFFY